ncbi:hypothetical protein B0H19DRAFT_1124928 [Mycena capillaripes]|nr:hypothetical protein B0H19DRAFT_1124928 [Mycena capillaripes]
MTCAPHQVRFRAFLVPSCARAPRPHLKRECEPALATIFSSTAVRTAESASSDAPHAFSTLSMPASDSLHRPCSSRSPK